MLSKSWCVVLAALGLALFGADSAFAWGGGAKGFWAGGGVSARHRTEWGYGGYGLGYGYGYPGWGYSPFIGGYYDLESLPYFAVFPPVYYGSGENGPVLNPSTRSSWAGIESPQPAPAPAASASPARPPLRIINPYYVETKADKP